MNRCHRCESDYTTPGTCNCYATRPVIDLQRTLDMARETELLRLRERDRRGRGGGCPICASGSGAPHGCISPYHNRMRGNL